MKHVVAAAAEIPPGGRKIVDIAGRSIGIFNLDGEYFALRNRCPHQGGALCEGKLWGVLRATLPGEFEYEPSREVLACPWHGWEFHLRTGQSWCEPERLRVRRYPVTVEEGRDLAAGAVRHEDAAITDGPGDDSAAPRPGMVKGPYTVDMYPVEIEGAYLVVEV
jgi:nitrite reductase/ring-hydroxylating ferredoxin subunit